MRQLVPPADSPATDVDPIPLYLDAHRPRPDRRPWVTVGMIQSADGAAAVAGRSGSLGGAGDKAVFRAVRGIADVILVGAGTVRAERYRAVQLPEEVAAARRAAGRATTPPRLAVVSGSLDLDLDADYLSPEARTIVFTHAGSRQRRRAELAEVAEVHLAGTDTVEPVRVLELLADLGAAVVVCEGGPTLNGQLVEADLVDEWCVTIAPAIAGGSSPRIAHGPDPIDSLHPVRLASLLEEDGYLFGRWLRAT